MAMTVKTQRRRRQGKREWAADAQNYASLEVPGYIVLLPKTGRIATHNKGPHGLAWFVKHRDACAFKRELNLHIPGCRVAAGRLTVEEDF